MTGSTIDLRHQTLKARQRNERHEHPPALALRVHRALSWYGRSEQGGDDQDARFIFLWIAFNAAYANEIDSHMRFTEQQLFTNFIDRLCQLDEHKLLYDLVWTEYANSIRILLDNKYVFQPFWDSLNGKLGRTDWESAFNRAKARAMTALSKQDTRTVICIVLARMYTLRNQIIHGGATWNSSVNRDQVRDCTNLLGKLVPIIILIMLDNCHALWGDACYPVVDS